MLAHWELVLRLVIAAGLGSLVGAERERLIWAAGLRIPAVAGGQGCRRAESCRTAECSRGRENPRLTGPMELLPAAEPGIARSLKSLLLSETPFAA